MAAAYPPDCPGISGQICQGLLSAVQFASRALVVQDDLRPVPGEIARQRQPLPGRSNNHYALTTPSLHDKYPLA
jgi:hypothetical protein